MGLMDNKVVLVTGGSRGIGEAIARKMAAEGAHVAFTYRSSAEKAEKIAAELSQISGKAKAYQSDASSFEETETLVKSIMEDFGQIDVLINNAGITRDNLLLRMSEDQWDQVINTNLKSIFNLSKQVIRPMMKARKGSIINISSIVGLTGNAGQSNYAASKAGAIGFSKSLAKELGSRNIRCNVIAPGFIETDMTEELPEDVKKSFMDGIPLKRMGTGEEIANTCLFLGSDMSAYVTGQVLSVCGGMY